MPRTDKGPKHLWAHQADVLRDYMTHLDTPDLALELPTGAGKTLVGMLIAEWRRRELGERVVYLCPTLQLARQALTDAYNAGINVIDMTGPSRDWSAAVELNYTRADAVAVAHYSAVFNSHPKLDQAGLLVFDDAHAAAGAVADTWTVRFAHDEPGYRVVVTLLADGLPANTSKALLDRALDPRLRRSGYLVNPALVHSKLEELSTALDAHTAGRNSSYGWRLIRDSLDSCCVFVAADEVIVRPMLPPTSTHLAYTNPAQRLYLSATMGAGGELERGFGRRKITRMAVPEGWDSRGTGRRFFIFPELTADFAQADGDEAVRTSMHQWVADLVADTGRALLLTPSSWALEQAQEDFVPPGFDKLSARDVERSLGPFTSSPRAVLGLANRYDGIDLPDDDCRLIVMSGLPVGADPQEKFYSASLGARRLLQERTRTRFAQGSGRATRNATDRSVVVVLGRPLISFAADRHIQAGTHPEIRAELDIGIMNSHEQSADDVRAAAREFLAQDPAWARDVEPEIRALRDTYSQAPDADDTLALAAGAPHEVVAVSAAWRGDWAAAVAAAERVLGALAGGAELRPYQALWNYLAADWARMASGGDRAYGAQADSFERAAQVAAARTTWMPNRQVVSGDADGPTDSDLDIDASHRVVAHARELGSIRRVNRVTSEMLGDLGQRGADRYERGLVTLGALLGAQSHKPAGDARADALWRWGQHLWFAWEAKSEVKNDKEVSPETVRQANTHLRSAASDLEEQMPPGSINVMVSAQSAVGQAAQALAADDLFFTSLEAVVDVAEAAVGAWHELCGRMLSDADPEELSTSVLASFRRANILPGDLTGRFAGRLF